MMGAAFSSASASVGKPKLKEFTFNALASVNPVLRVTSSDNKKWDTIEPGSGSFLGNMIADARYPTYVGAVGVFLGQCVSTACAINAQNGGPLSVTGNSSLVFTQSGVKTRDYNTTQTISFGYRQLGDVKVSTGANNATYKERILAKCNSELKENGPSEKAGFLLEVAVTFGVAATGHRGRVKKAKSLSLYSINKTKRASFWIEVACEPTEKPAPKTAVLKLDPLRVDYLKVFLSTFSHAMTQPKAGVQCQKGRVLMRVRTNRLGPVKLKLESRVGNEPLTLDIYETFAKLNNDGVPEAEIKKWFTTTKTTILKARLSTIDPAGTSTEWKELPLNCSSPGGGGWAQPASDDIPGVDNTGNEATPTDIPAAIKGELVLVDSSKTGVGKVRQARAILKMSGKENKVQQYTLRCSGDRYWSRQVQPVKMQDGQYGYAQTHVFPIEKTELVKCVLRATSTESSIVLDTKERIYTVITPGSSNPGVGNMTPKKGPLTIESAVELRDNSAKASFKTPRNGVVKISVTSNRSGKVSY
ncbi:MAG: hypothetical protein ABJN51_05425, partial [Sneathiella sp.]